jgi:hypothetical protein
VDTNGSFATMRSTSSRSSPRATMTPSCVSDHRFRRENEQSALRVFFLAPAARREDGYATDAGREWRDDVAAVSDRESAAAWRFPRRRRDGRVRCSTGGCVGRAPRRCCAPARRGQLSGRHRRDGGDPARHGQVRGASDREVPLGVRGAEARPAYPRTTRRCHPNGARQSTAHRTAAGDPLSVPADGHDLRRLWAGYGPQLGASLHDPRCARARPAWPRDAPAGRARPDARTDHDPNL